MERNCKNCKNQDCYWMGMDDDDICDEFLPKTNADRIRSMTDEELLNWINGIPSACMDFDNESRCTLFDDCRECWQEWLKQKVSFDDEDN